MNELSQYFNREIAPYGFDEIQVLELDEDDYLTECLVCGLEFPASKAVKATTVLKNGKPHVGHICSEECTDELAMRSRLAVGARA